MFGNSKNHINYADNTLVEKIQKVEYDINYIDGYDGQWYDAVLTSEQRPTLDSIFEKKVKYRLSKFHAKPIDRTQFDRELLQKQMDLETMKITLQDEDDKVKDVFLNECGGQCCHQPYKRVISRETNEEGRFKRLMNEIEQMANQYGVSLDYALETFEAVSCSKKHLKVALEKKQFTKWQPIEDIGLR